jgi:glycosyltransferase involved in cell wall biosynthesis
MMTARGHQVFTYCVEGSKTASTEDVICVDKKTYDKCYGGYDYRSEFFRYDVNDDVYLEYARRAIFEIRQRAQPNDFILPFWGAGNRQICDAIPQLTTVEPGIGYARGHWSKYKIFESYAIMHAWYGLEGVERCRMDNYATVIPNYFDAEDFEYRENKDDYLLFLSRVYEGKGLHIAIQAAAATGHRLVIAGQGSLEAAGYTSTPSHVEFVGYADRDRRRELMAGAKALLVGSQYVEPFGGVQIEALLSGTPTITSDIGAFTENNLPGTTGYRCRTFDHWCWAIENIGRIQPSNCRLWAEQNFTLEAVAPRYEDYFQSVLDIKNGHGWYERHLDRSDVPNTRIYP